MLPFFRKILHFYPTPKKWGPKNDFFVLLNAPVGVHERVENLLRRIGIRDSSFCDNLIKIRINDYTYNFSFLKIVIAKF